MKNANSPYNNGKKNARYNSPTFISSITFYNINDNNNKSCDNFSNIKYKKN